jgi:SanA protein
MLKKSLSMVIQLLFWLLIAAIIVLGVPRLITELTSRGKFFTIDTAAPSKAAIVFGAGLQRDGTPSPVLKDRVAIAARLYFAGKVQRILMSGDNRFVEYNEPAAMQAYALQLGVPNEVIVMDFAGRRTYDTCYRALHIFGLKDAILVTQRYHLPRALFTCNGIGLQAVGIEADLRDYHISAQRFWKLREIPATLVAVWQVWISHPLPVLGDPEPIFADESSGQ